MNKSQYFKFIIFLLIVFLLTTNINYLHAEDSKHEKTAVYIKTGHIKYVKELIEFTNGVEIKKEDNIMKAPSGNYNKEKEKAFLEKGVTVSYKNGNIESEIMTGWLNDNKYIFENNVKLHHTLSNDKILILEAPYLEMLNSTNSFTANNGVIIHYENRVIKSKTAKFNDDTKILVLSENVYIKEDEGWIRSDKAEFNLEAENEEFTADGNVELEL